MMKRFCSIYTLVLLTNCLIAQDQKASFDSKYGVDADLVNGEKYYYPYHSTEGDPFLDFESQRSTIRIKEKIFEDQSVKYDIYNQSLILEYEDLYGSVTSLVIRNEWLKGFSYGEREFKKIEGPEGKEEFYQILYSGNVSCYYLWRKDYLMNLSSGVQSYYFTEPIREAYIVKKDQFYPFRNSRTFSMVFGKELQKTIRQHIRQANMNIKIISDQQMWDLVKYCNSLLGDAL